MTISVSLGFDPIWSNFNILGVSAGGASLYSYDSLNPTVPKPIYSDPGGLFPYPNPILFDQNGNAPGPFYFTLDSLSPTSLYDLFLYDTQGNLIWNVDGYFPGGGSGGSTVTAINIQNLITNSVLWRNIGGVESSVNTFPTTLGTRTQIAPGAHDGLSFNVSPTPTSGTANSFGPDIYFFKNNSSGTDIVSFPIFTLGSTPFTNDVTPIQYVNHKSTVAGTSETFKYYQFPISAKLQNLTNQNVTLRIWGQGVSGSAQTLSLSWAQFYGDGLGATPTVITPIQTITLTSSWVSTTIATTVPNVSGGTLGPCGNDGLFLLIELPLDSTFEINFAKPALYLGNIAPTADFNVYDNIDAAVNTPRTGDIRSSLNSFSPFGWVPLNDGTIGNIASSATTRARSDTFPLFNLIWNSVRNEFAPVTPTRGASAIADFQANKRIQLTKALGRVLAGTQTPIVNVSFSVPTSNVLTVADATLFHLAAPITIGATVAPTGLVLGVIYYVIPISATTFALASTPENAITPVVLPITAGSGTGPFNVITPAFIVGQFRGEETHTLTIPEMPSHTHPIFSSSNVQVSTGPGFFVPRDIPSTTGATGGILG